MQIVSLEACRVKSRLFSGAGSVAISIVADYQQDSRMFEFAIDNKTLAQGRMMSIPFFSSTPSADRIGDAAGEDWAIRCFNTRSAAPFSETHGPARWYLDDLALRADHPGRTKRDYALGMLSIQAQTDK